MDENDKDKDKTIGGMEEEEFQREMMKANVLESTIMMCCRFNQISYPVCMMVFEKLIGFLLMRAEGQLTQEEVNAGKTQTSMTTEMRIEGIVRHVRESFNEWKAAQAKLDSGADGLGIEPGKNLNLDDFDFGKGGVH